MSLNIPGYYFDKAKNRWFKGAPPAPPPTDRRARNTPRNNKSPQSLSKFPRSQFTPLPLMPLFSTAKSLSSALFRRELVPRNANDYLSKGPLGHDAGVASWADALVSRRKFGLGGLDGSERRALAGMLVFAGVESRSAYARDAVVIYAHPRQAGLRVKGILTQPSGLDHEAPLPPTHVSERLRRELVHDVSGITYMPSQRLVLVNGYEPPIKHMVVSMFPVEWATDSIDEPLIDTTRRTQWRMSGIANCITPAPPDSGFTFAAGTDDGIFVANGIDFCAKTLTRWPESVSDKPDNWTAPPILDVCWDPDNSFLLYGGTRAGVVWMADTRTKETRMTGIHHPAPVAKIFSMGSHQLLCAGPLDEMALYDKRFAKKTSAGTPPRPQKPRSRTPKRPSTTPTARFPEYENAERIHFGIAVSASLGVVATAREDGSVGLHSLRTGLGLASPVFDGNEGSESNEPAQVLQFAQAEGDRLPSLWAGGAAGVGRYSVASVDE